MIALTKKGKWVIGIISVLTAIVFIIPKNSEDNENASAKLTQAAEKTIENDKSYERNNHEENVNRQNIEVKGLNLATEDVEIRNPFTYSHETRNEKPVKRDIKVVNIPKPTEKTVIPPIPKTNETTSNLPRKNWKLTGIIIAGENKTAILSCENESKILSVGDEFDNKIITAIEDDYILYSDINGNGRLNIVLP